MEYFDFNATTPMCQAALDKWNEINTDFFGNPSSLHRVGRRADHIIEDCRRTIAELISTSPDWIVWTSGATESNNMVFHHLRSIFDENEDVWISDIEHPCVRNSAFHYFGGHVHTIPVTNSGFIDVSDFEKRLRNAETKPVCVSVMAANNETGALQDWQSLVKICHENGVLFHCDAAQWLGKLPASNLGDCDYVSAASHKFTGPKGCGFLKIPTQQKWHPLIHGGGQEYGRRAGTENVSGIASMTEALAYRDSQIQNGFISERYEWKNKIVEMMQATIPEIRTVSEVDRSLWNTIMVLMPDADCRQRWVVKLDKSGYAVSSGSACSSGEEKPSHVLSAMGLSAAESGRAIRMSGGWETQLESWDGLIQAIGNVAQEM